MKVNVDESGVNYGWYWKGIGRVLRCHGWSQGCQVQVRGRVILTAYIDTLCSSIIYYLVSRSTGVSRPIDCSLLLPAINLRSHFRSNPVVIPGGSPQAQSQV